MNYSYDDAGNLLSVTDKINGIQNGTNAYTYDILNRVIKLTQSGTGVTSVNDRRIGKKIDGVTTERYVYDGSNIALVFDGTGTQTHRYLYGVGVDQVLADERGGTVVWALSDNQGTVRDVVDGNRTILNHVVYDSFGQVVGQSNASVEFRYGYTGREQDSETGLDYYRARYYDAGNGRFISEDPIGFSAGDSNLTRYVGNSPTNWVDPSGLEPNKAQAGTVEGFIDFMSNSERIPSKMGKAKGAEAEKQLNRLGEVDWKFTPATTSPFNSAPDRYIYTTKVGWIDMSHFLFYAGRAYQVISNPAFKYQPDLKNYAIAGCIHDGYKQEFTDQLVNADSAYSYEDLPSDRFGAEFAAKYFDPKSNLTLAEQIGNYLKNKLGAVEGRKAPNYKDIPGIEPDNGKPTWTNHTTEPMFTTKK
jgi:RHS repeat-associated protein